MYKDFKKSESLDTGFVGGSGIIWMFSGIVLGLVVGLGMYYFTNTNSSAFFMARTVNDKIKKAQSAKPLLTSRAQQITNTSKNTKVLYKPKQTQERTTKFSYYAVLPTLDVPTGFEKPIDTSPKLIAADGKVVETISPEVVVKKEIIEDRAIPKDGDYLLQVASYKKKSRANLTRGRLTKKGIEAYIKSKKIKGRTWYRVVAGPVDQTSIVDWKSAAEKMGHRPLVISLR